MTTALFPSIDNALGDHHDRYFGIGHKRTSYSLLDVATSPQGSTGSLRVEHQGTWSQKAEGQARPHLSTIDAIIAGTLIAQDHLRATDRGSEQRLAGLRLARVRLRTGSAPVEAFEAIPIRLTESRSDTDDEHRFTCRVGSMFADLVLRAQTPRHPLAFDPGAQDYYSTHLRDHRQEITAIAAAPHVLSAEVTVHRDGPRRASRGIQSAFADTLSALDYVLAFAQLAQVLAYHHDDLARANSDTFWLRSLTMDLTDRPAALCVPQRMSGRITNPRILTMADTPWRLFRMKSEVPSVTCSVEVAHTLRHAGAHS